MTKISIVLIGCFFVAAVSISFVLRPLSSLSAVFLAKVDDVFINVPFTSQAPFADWGDPYQEACEEASLIMVHHFLTDSSLTKKQADEELLDLTSWIAGQGLPEDLTIDQVASIAEEYYGHKTRIIRNPSITSIITELDAGNPVIVPAAGRLLGNPYFSGEGPWYHMLVLTGHTEDSFITNDPGTRRGKDYMYNFDTLYNSIHNWTGVKEEINEGPKVVLIVY